MKEIILTTNSGYVFNEETKKLEYFDYEKSVFNFESGKVFYHGKLGGVDSVIESMDRYRDEESFKRGAILGGGDMKFTIQAVQNYGLRYVFKDGQATPIPNDYDYEVEHSRWRVRLANGERAYASKEEAYDFNNIVVKEADGTERVVECAYSKCKLTETQESLLTQLEDLVASMEKENLSFIYDERDGKVKVINKTRIERIETDCERYDSCEGWADVQNMYVPTSLHCLYTHDDEYVNAKFKD